MHYKWFHLLEKQQLSQEMVQRCENHQIRRADFVEKIHGFLARPYAKTYTWASSMASFKEAQPLALIVALVWLLPGRRLHQFVG